MNPNESKLALCLDCGYMPYASHMKCESCGSKNVTDLLPDEEFNVLYVPEFNSKVTMHGRIDVYREIHTVNFCGKPSRPDKCRMCLLKSSCAKQVNP